MEMILAFIGSIFLLVAFFMFYINLKYRESGKSINGKVIAIEKYVSRSVSSRGRSSQLMYRPIYEYNHEGKTYWFYSGSKNTISHKINQQVNLLKLPGGPEYILPEKNVYTLFSTVFGLFGIISWTIFLSSDHSIFFKLISIALVIGTISIGIQQVRKKFPKLNFFNELLKSNHLVTKEDLEGRTIFWQQAEVLKEVAFINKVGIWIALAFMTFSGGLTYLCWSKMNSTVKSHLMEIGFEFSRWPELKSYFPREGELIGFIVGLFFLLISVYSILYSFRKM